MRCFCAHIFLHAKYIGTDARRSRVPRTAIDQNRRRNLSKLIQNVLWFDQVHKQVNIFDRNLEGRGILVNSKLIQVTDLFSSLENRKSQRILIFGKIFVLDKKYRINDHHEDFSANLELRYHETRNFVCRPL